MSTTEFSKLGNSEETWTCPSCLKPNNSSTILYTVLCNGDSKHSSVNISTNPLLVDSISEASIPSTSGSSINSPSFNATSFSSDAPIMTSSPKPTKAKPTHKKQVRILNINFQSLRKKGKLLETIIESSDPDIIIGTETWLDPTFRSSEIFPDYLYDIERRDRPKDPHGGVLIAAKKQLQLGNITKSKDIELITGSVSLEGKKKMLVGAFYRPPDKTDEDYLNKVKEEISTIKEKHCRDIFVIGGDFNLPDINWEEQTIINRQYPIKTNQTFLEIVADNGLEQIVDFPTRKDNTLDLMLLSHPAYKLRCKPLPLIGNSDHDIVLLDIACKPFKPKPVRRKIYLWKKADIYKIKEDLESFGNTFRNIGKRHIESLWQALKDAIQNTIDKRVPSKMTQGRHTHPWINTTIRQKINRKQKAHKKARKTKKKRDVDRYKRLQQEVQYEVRQANKKYMEDESTDYKENSKKFWSFIKSKGQEWTGVAPLKNKMGFLQSDNKSKAEILNEQFQSVFTKEILEHIVHSNIMDHFDKNKILTNAQHGFRKKRSCESQLIVTIHEIASKLEKGSQVDIILLDFAKAFDKVPHQRLLHKLEYYGVNAKTKNWIQSFLQNRQQRVILEGAASEQAPVLSGVPQGTVLGPLLFLTYINDMPEMVKSSETKLFADDSLLFRTINNQADSVLLQNDLTSLQDWEDKWQMSFNAKKCQVIRITPRNRPPLPTTYKLHGHTLDTVDASKYLGVTISNNLTWDRHIDNTIGKGNKTLGFIRRNLKDCTKPVKSAAYTSMVRPTMEYASSVWDPTNRKKIGNLEKVQKRAARFIFNNYTDRTPGCVTRMVESLKWEKLEERRKSNRLCMLYKIKNGLMI